MNKKILKMLLIVTIIVFGVSIYLFIKEENYKNKIEKLEFEKNQKINEIKSHFSTSVITLNEATLYKKVDNTYNQYGNINKNVKLKLQEENINENTEYFYIPDLDVYISYKNVNPIEEYKKSDRYKNYIPFNKNIKTKEKTSFFDNEGKLLYTINQSFDFPIIINDNDKYGIVYNNKLLYIKESDVSSIYDNLNTNEKSKSRIRVLTYHAIYDPSTTECNTSICQTIQMFESHLKYIRENNYFTLRLKELELYLDGKLQIPEKSIVLTIDDGTLLDQQALKLLEKYESNATLFAVTSWVNPDNFKSDYLDLESHTDNMHNQYECKGYGMQGGGILCLPEEQVLNDLKTSQEKLGGSEYFAYPFFDFNQRAIEILKKAGFKLAFIGQYDTDGYSYPLVTDRYKVRRKTIFSDTSMSEFISYLQ